VELRRVGIDRPVEADDGAGDWVIHGRAPAKATARKLFGGH
jgi:hypothetical protein